MPGYQHKDSASVGLGWGPGVNLFNKHPSDSDEGGPWATFREILTY